MAKPKMTRELASAAAKDAANRQMRAEGRRAWSQKDYSLARDTLARLLREEASK